MGNYISRIPNEQANTVTALLEHAQGALSSAYGDEDYGYGSDDDDQAFGEELDFARAHGFDIERQTVTFDFAYSGLVPGEIMLTPGLDLLANIRTFGNGVIKTSPTANTVFVFTNYNTKSLAGAATLGIATDTDKAAWERIISESILVSPLQVEKMKFSSSDAVKLASLKVILEDQETMRNDYNVRTIVVGQATSSAQQQLGIVEVNDKFYLSKDKIARLYIPSAASGTPFNFQMIVYLKKMVRAGKGGDFTQQYNTLGQKAVITTQPMSTRMGGTSIMGGSRGGFSSMPLIGGGRR
jgi:hypothetical protein